MPLRWRRFIVVEGDHWLWTGHTNKAGYGRASLYIERRQIGWLAHRLVWTLLVGIPPADLHHHCRLPNCVRPHKNHVKAVTSQEHRVIHATEDRTHCKNNHEFTVENTYWRTPTSRQCRRCKADIESARRAQDPTGFDAERTERRRRQRVAAR